MCGIGPASLPPEPSPILSLFFHYRYLTASPIESQSFSISHVDFVDIPFASLVIHH